MDYTEEHFEALQDTIQVPQLVVPQPRFTPGLNVISPIVDPIRSRIQLLEPDTIREQAPPPPLPRRVAPPPELTNADSINFNLTGNKDLFINWELQFDTVSFHQEVSKPRISETYLKKEMQLDSDSIIVVGEFVSPEFESDTIRTVYTTLPVESTPGVDFFSEKSLLQSDWFTGVLVFGVLVLGYIRLSWNRYLQDILQSVIYPSFIARLSSSNASNFWPSLLLGFLFYFNSSVFIFQILTIVEKPIWGITGSILLPLIFLFLFLIFTLKVIAYRAVGKIFGTSDAVHKYLSESSATGKAYSLFILPVILFLPYLDLAVQEVLIRIGIGMFIFLYLMQIARGVKENYSNLLSGYYIILYLCALEILPLSILFKVLFK